MRLNRTHKDALLKFALERTTIDPTEIAKYDAAAVSFLNTVGEYFAKQMGADYASLKKHKSIKALEQLKFREYMGTKDKRGDEEYKDRVIRMPSPDDLTGACSAVHVPITANHCSTYVSDLYYKLPKAVMNAANKYRAAKKHHDSLVNEHKQAFDNLVSEMTTFKAACEVFPEFENAAHLVMSNTQLVVTNAEWRKTIAKFAVVK